MSLFNRSLKAIWVSYRPIVVNTVKDLLLSSRIRLYATEVKAVQKLSFRSQKRHKKNVDFGGYFMLILPISGFGLGTWQVFRKFEKEKIIEEFMEKINLPPVELPKNLEELEKMEFRSIKVKGRFDHSRELFLGPRPEVSDDPISKVSTLLSRSKGGYMVITPFVLSDRNLTILVNRGWVPSALKSPVTRPEGQITEEVELVGLVRTHERRPPLGMKNMPQLGYWVYRDLHKMAEVADTAPVLLDADKASTVTGGPIGGQTIVEVRNVHVSYIFTWYGFALLSSWLWYKRYLYKKPPGLGYIPRGL